MVVVVWVDCIFVMSNCWVVCMLGVIECVCVIVVVNMVVIRVVVNVCYI